MAVTVKKARLWRRDVANDRGQLADVLEPLAEAGANLRVVMGYAIPGDPTRAVVEVFPITGRRATAAAERVGLAGSPIACLVVEGNDRPGLGAYMARAIAAQGVNISFLMAETLGRKFSAVLGFESDADAATATRAIKSAAKAAAAPRRRSA